MKLVISKDLKKRIRFAAANGSKVAEVIYGIINTDKVLELSDVMLGKSNFFDSVRIVSHGSSYDTIKIEITYCPNDTESEHFPERDNAVAGYDQNNRSRMSTVKFAKMFKAINKMYNDGDINVSALEYFENVIRIGQKVNFSLTSNPLDFYKAYSMEYYCRLTDGASTLWNSCMRYEDQSRVASDFYSHFCGCKILRAFNDDGETLARAVIWPKVMISGCDEPLCLIERIYTSFSSVRTLMLEYAKNNGVQIRKTIDSYSEKCKFTTICDCELGDNDTDHIGNAYVVVPQVKWHHGGAPYLDTFTFAYKPKGHNGYLYLANSSISGLVGEDLQYIAELDNTSGVACRQGYVCPVCGKPSSDEAGKDCLCSECRDKLIKLSVVGYTLSGGVTEYKGQYYPTECFVNGQPTKALEMYLNINKLF